jgi:hypothetical protein
MTKAIVFHPSENRFLVAGDCAGISIMMELSHHNDVAGGSHGVN